MYQVKIKIEGIVPLKMNKFLGLPGTSTKLTEEELLQDAYDRTYKDEKGKYCVEKKSIKACFVNGGKKVKVGRGSASALLRAIFHIDKDTIALPIQKPHILKQVVRIPPKTGGRVMKYFVFFPKWSLNFTATIIDDRFPEEALKNSIIEAGMYYGLLEERPDYGRFVLESFEKIK